MQTDKSARASLIKKMDQLCLRLVQDGRKIESSPSHASKSPSKVGNQHDCFCNPHDGRPEQTEVGDDLHFAGADHKAVSQKGKVQRKLAQHNAAVQQ